MCIRDRDKRIATEYVNLTKQWLAANNIAANVEFSWGACEMKVPHLADVVVVNTLSLIHILQLQAIVNVLL